MHDRAWLILANRNARDVFFIGEYDEPISIMTNCMIEPGNLQFAQDQFPKIQANLRILHGILKAKLFLKDGPVEAPNKNTNSN